jgi:hypothetical protein
MPRYHTREAPAVAKPRHQPAQVLVCDSRHPAGNDMGVFCLERWRWRPCHKTPALTLAPAPNSAARCHSSGNPTARWAARSRMALASAPSDGDDSAPPPAVSIIDLLTMLCRQAMKQTAAAQHDRNSVGGRRRRSHATAAAFAAGGGGGGGGGCAGGGRHHDAASLPCFLIMMWFLLEGVLEFHWK